MNLKNIFFPHDDKPGHIKSLDGLRGIAVIIVLLAHSHHVDGDNNIFQYFGRFGVYLFYILSAYLLDSQIIHYLNSSKKRSNYWYNYALRRFLRIYPIYIIFLVTYYLLNRNYLGNFVKSIDQIIDSFFLLDGPGVFWSIPVEFKYYIISPFLMVFFHSIFKWRLKPIIITIISIILISFITELKIGLSWYSTLKSITPLFIGSFIAIIESKDIKIKNRLFIKIEIASLIGIILCNPYSLAVFDIEPDIIHLIRIYFFPFYLGVLFYSSKHGSIKSLMENKFLRFLGNISFSIYLSHMIIALGLKKYGFGEILNFVFYPVLTIITSMISYIIIEYPLSKIKLKSKYSIGTVNA